MKIREMEIDEEEEIPNKIPAKTRNVDPKLLDLFWKAVENDSTKRLNAITDIISILIQEALVQKEPSENLKYCLERCVKGLPSTRKCARHGFTVLLTEILKRFTTIKVDTVLELIEEHLAFDKGKGEKGSLTIGRSLALGAIIRSGRIVDEPSLGNKIIKELLVLSRQRDYIKLANCLIIEDCLKQLADISFEMILPAMEDELKQGYKSGSPETVWLAITCQSIYKKQTFDFMERYWDGKHIFDVAKTGVELIGPIIKKTTSVHPKIHPLCTALVSHCLKRKNLAKLWKKLIEETILESSFQGTYLAFELLQVIIPKLSTAVEVSSILTPKLVENVLTSLKGKSHPLRFAAEKMLEWLVNYLKETEDPEIQFQVIKAFTTLPGSVLFDSLTRTQFLGNAIPNLLPETCTKYADFLTKVICLPSESDENLQNSLSCAAAKQLGLLVIHLGSEEWKLRILLFLFLCGFFKDIETNDVVPMFNDDPLSLSPSVREACKLNFLRGVELLLRPQAREGYKMRLSNACNSLIPLMDGINQIVMSPEIFSSAQNINKIKDSWSGTFKLIKKFKKCDKKDQKEDESHMFQVLLGNLGILLFYADVHGQDLTVLDELQECAKRALKARQRGVEADGPAWINVLTDIFLSILSDGSQFLRKSIECTFPLFCPFLTPEALQQILDVFKFDKSEDILMSKEDNDSEEDEESLEFESPSISDTDGEDDEGDKIGAVDELRLKLQQALGPIVQPSGDDDDDDEDEQYLSDSEMFKLDGAISEAFKEHIKKPKEGQAKELSLLNFRLRCLDLLLKYIKLGPPLKMVFQFSEPLLNVFEHGMRSKNQLALGQKALSLLEALIHFSRTHKFAENESENITEDDMKQLLTKILGRIRKTTDGQQSNVLSKTCIFLIRCFKKASTTKPQKETWYIPLFKELLQDYLLQSSSHVNPEIFNKLLQSFPEFGPVFLPILVELSLSEVVRLFKKTQACSLLAASARATASNQAFDCKKWQEFCEALVPKVIAALEAQLNSDLKISHTLQMLTALESVLQAQNKQCQKENVKMQPLPSLVKVLKKVQTTKFGKKFRKNIQSLNRLANCGPNEMKAPLTAAEKLKKKKDKKILKQKKNAARKEKAKKLKERKQKKKLLNGHQTEGGPKTASETPNEPVPAENGSMESSKVKRRKVTKQNV